MNRNIYEMRFLLSHPLSLAGKILLGIGLFLLALGAILFPVIPDRLESIMVLFAIAFPGLIMAIIGFIFARIVAGNNKNLQILKQEGKSYDAEIVRLNIAWGINVGATPAVSAECIYTNDNGQRCKVKSPLFVWLSMNPDGLKATVYTDYNDPQKYAVEIIRREENQPHVDIDYT
ncbi:MAG: hypothetical protein FWF79_09745 [Defluviitaleaceae bacterium]|nr:hypothetical protein [Defluviitaleaceae bacterium]